MVIKCYVGHNGWPHGGYGGYKPANKRTIKEEDASASSKASSSISIFFDRDEDN
jgi:hypothetical protein